LMLIHRKLILVIVELLEVVAEPVGEALVDRGDRFAEPAAAQRCAAAPGAIGADQREALVLCAGPEGRLSAARMADDGDVGAVDRRVGLQIIQHAARAPGPGADGSPGILSERAAAPRPHAAHAGGT